MERSLHSASLAFHIVFPSSWLASEQNNLAITDNNTHTEGVLWDSRMSSSKRQGSWFHTLTSPECRKSPKVAENAVSPPSWSTTSRTEHWGYHLWNSSSVPFWWDFLFIMLFSSLCIRWKYAHIPPLPYNLAYKPPLRYKPPRLISPLLAKGRCKICMAHRPSTIVNPFAIRPPPPKERAFVSHGPHRGGLYARLYGMLNARNSCFVMLLWSLLYSAEIYNHSTQCSD